MASGPIANPSTAYRQDGNKFGIDPGVPGGKKQTGKPHEVKGKIAEVRERAMSPYRLKKNQRFNQE